MTSKLIDTNKNPFIKGYYNFKYFIQRIFFKRKLLRKAAIHESGHIVFSYFYDFTVRHSELSTIILGNGQTEFVFGSKAIATNIIFQNLISSFAGLTQAQQQGVVLTAHHLMVIMAGGAIAEACVQKQQHQENYKLDISGPDLEAVKSIERFFLKINLNRSSEEVVGTTLGKLIEPNPIFKTTILALSEKFLSSPSYRLTQLQIEQTLNEVDFFGEKTKILAARQTSKVV